MKLKLILTEYINGIRILLEKVSITIAILFFGQFLTYASEILL